MEKNEPMRVFLPLGFLLGSLALGSLACAVSRARGVSVSRLRAAALTVNSVAGVTLGVLTLISISLPWVIAERSEPLLETRFGVYDVGRYHELSGVVLLTGINRVDEILLVLAGTTTGILYIPLLSLVEDERSSVERAFLFLLGCTCNMVPAALVHAQRSWWVNMYVNGALGFSVTSVGLGSGFLIVTLCAIGLLAVGAINVVRALKRSPT